MTNRERETIIKNAILEYNNAKRTGEADEIKRAANMAHNVFIMCSCRNVKGVEELRKIINTEKGL